VLLFHLIFSLSMAAQDFQLKTGARAGMGGLGAAVTGDADSIDWNPASLGETKHRIQFLITPVSTRVQIDDWAVETVTRLLDGTLPPEQYPQLLADIKGPSVRAMLELSGGAHITVGGNGVGASVRGFLHGQMAKDAVSLLLLENTIGTTYHLDGTEVEGGVLGDIRIASVYSDPWLARVLRISGFHMGGTLHYLHGLEYGKASASGTLQVVEDGGTYMKVGDGKVVTWRSQTGFGVATDLGVLLRLTPAIAIDASIVDLGHTWWYDVEETVFEYQVDPVTGRGSYVHTEARAVADRPKWATPASLRAGLSVKADEGVLWTLQYSRRLFGPKAGSEEWVLATELKRIPALPLRLGVRYTSDEPELQFSLGLGVHLGPLTLDIGTPDLTGLLYRTKDASLSISTGLRF
jgi:hypothetical protein